MKGKTGNFGYKVLGVIALAALLVHASARPHFSPFGGGNPAPDTPNTDSPKLRFPIQDRSGDPMHDRYRPGFDLRDPENLERDVQYDPEFNRYYFNNRLGEDFIRNPTYLTYEEYLKYMGDQQEREYWKRRLDALSMFNTKPSLPTMYKEGIFDRIFGGTSISVIPQGNVDLTFAYVHQNIDNPNIPLNNRKYGIFDFDMNMNLNVVAAIGEKLKFNINQNTKPTFGEQNISKLDYSGKDDEIIKRIEAGNISFPVNSALITGATSLFGLKTQLQFGKLWLTTAISQQKSRRNSLTVQGGAQTQQFAIKADDYDENRHFLLAQYFRDNYNKALKDYPILNAPTNITKIEVWVTNRTGTPTDVRDVLTFMDLGEVDPYLAALNDPAKPSVPGYPDNRSNRLYDQLQQNPATRSRLANNSLQLMGLNEPVDYQRTTARKLNPSEFSYDPRLGYISLVSQPNPDDIVGVAFQYTVNGQTYQVGEFASDLPPDTTNQKLLFLKMLKGTSPRPTMPMWDLMMKNIYPIGGYGISKDDFRLNVLYQDPGGGEKRYLPEGDNAGKPLISLLNLDRLNFNNDPFPDGVFDYVEGITINTQQGKIIFPVLEPFGADLKPAIGNDPVLERKYLYNVLYDSTKTIARQYQQQNRFVMKGSYKGSSSSEIYLGGFNIPQGSVSVSAGGQRLVENVDYQIDYGLGRVKILNQGILNSGIPVTIQYEDNANFGFTQQNFMGARAEYFFNENLTLGGTFMRLREIPFTQKTSFGEDPIQNTVLGTDINYNAESKALTRLLDKLPLYSTSAPSFVTANAEVAGLFPGHSKQIDVLDPGGTVYIDDFEGTRSSFDLKFPPNSWQLSSVPVGARDRFGNVLFPESNVSDTTTSGINRARLAWYFIDRDLTDPTSGTVPDFSKNDSAQHYIRPFFLEDIYPQRSFNSLTSYSNTFDLGFYPKERGPYNFDAINVNTDGTLRNPENRWGGIMRAIENSDFEQSNVEFIEFWMLDPFINRPNNAGGSLYINLGNVSEDILKDGSKFFENGVPYPYDINKLTRTQWGYVPLFQQQITRAFDNDPNARERQDVGYDGLNNSEESQHFSNFLSQLASTLGGTNSPAYQKVANDPASDDYRYFRDSVYDNTVGVLTRYKLFNNPQGNSPVLQGNQALSNAATVNPEAEDINRDNTMNQSEEYYQYRLELKPNMQVGESFIVSKQTPSVKLLNGNQASETWYQFKIPIREFQDKVGEISDFRSIRFIRMFLAGFSDSVILRFAKLELGRNNWRRYLFSLQNPGENIPPDEQALTPFEVTSVSLEENSGRQPIPYVIPPGVQRQLQTLSNNQQVQQNEQSLALRVCGLKDGDARAVFKETNVDMRQFEKLRMFIHAESQVNQAVVQDGEVRAIIRMGSDFTNNYYEYQVPLKMTAFGSTSPEAIWPEQNNIELTLETLVNIKTERNNSGQPSYVPYSATDEKGNTIVIVGNPNLGDTKTMMLGILNPKKTLATPNDDGADKCVEVWFNELRASGMNETPGYAASARVSMQLADLGSLRAGGTMHTEGYGNIDQRINQRFRDNFYQYDASSNLQLGKLMPRNWGVQLPFFIGYNETVSNPQYDPYDLDVKLKDKLNAANSSSERDSIRKAAQDYNSITSFNFTNVRILGNPEKQGRKAMPWSIRNFDVSYSYNKNLRRNPLLEKDQLTQHRLGLGYTYAFGGKPIEPFKKLIQSKSRWLSLIKDFNFNPLPSNFAFRTDLLRDINETLVRNIGDGPYKIEPTYFKNFIWSRDYTLRWELTKSLSFDYHALNLSRIDEPYGKIDNAQKRDTLWDRFKTFGRNTQYAHDFNVSYNLPLSKLPLTDWTNLRFQYGGTYQWTAASLLAKSQGNTIANTQNIQINGELNFSQLYSKNKYLRAIMQPAPKIPKSNKPNEPKTEFLGSKSKDGKERNVADDAPGSDFGAVKEKAPTGEKVADKKQDTIRQIDLTGMSKVQIDSIKKIQKEERIARNKKEKEERKKARIAARKERRARPANVSGIARFFGRLLLSLRRVSVNYTENSGSILPGYMDSTRFLGINDRSGYPGINFVAGYQPDQAWLDAMARANKFTNDSLFNTQLTQNYSQTLNLNATLEPIQDFRVDVTLTKNFSKFQTELFKDVDYDGTWDHLNPTANGTFTMSYIGMRTMFKSTGLNSAVFNNFINNGEVVSARLGRNNPYTNDAKDPNDPNYSKGYTKFSQDVLIPSFIAAYTGRDANSIALIDYDYSNLKRNPFRYFTPLPNWRVSYNGLSKLELLKPIFSTLALSHAYTSTLSMNSFTTSLFYRDEFGLGAPSFIDSNSGNFVPFYQVPNLTLTDQFSPLVGVEATFTNELTASFQYRKVRTVSLSLIDYQIAETKSTEYVVGAGIRLKGLTLPFSIFGVSRLENDINIKVDVSLRDDLNTSNYFALKTEVPTRGQKVTTISPTIDYIINDRLTLRLFYDRRSTKPYTTPPYPITNTRAGITLRFIFAQ